MSEIRWCAKCGEEIDLADETSENPETDITVFNDGVKETVWHYDHYMEDFIAGNLEYLDSTKPK